MQQAPASLATQLHSVLEKWHFLCLCRHKAPCRHFRAAAVAAVHAQGSLVSRVMSCLKG